VGARDVPDLAGVLLGVRTDLDHEAVDLLRRLGRPFLDWTGKAERLSFEVPTLPLFIHERLSTKGIVETLTGHRRDKQQTMFELFGAPQHPVADQILRAYEYPDNWVNRLVLGDWLVVMNSLLHYEGLGAQVQMIYMDPPYGIRFGSNFQPFVRRRDVSHNDDTDMTREPEMVKAYRDTWELGLHSYLTNRDRPGELVGLAERNAPAPARFDIESGCPREVERFGLRRSTLATLGPTDVEPALGPHSATINVMKWGERGEGRPPLDSVGDPRPDKPDATSQVPGYCSVSVGFYAQPFPVNPSPDEMLPGNRRCALSMSPGARHLRVSGGGHQSDLAGDHSRANASGRPRPQVQQARVCRRRPVASSHMGGSLGQGAAEMHTLVDSAGRGKWTTAHSVTAVARLRAVAVRLYVTINTSRKRGNDDSSPYDPRRSGALNPLRLDPDDE